MNTKLSFADIVDLFATKTGQSKKEAELFLRELLDTMASKMCEEGLLKIRDFGTFKVVEVESRESVDVNTGDKIVIASHRKISFVADKTLKDLVNKPFSLFEPELLKDGVSFGQSASEKDTEGEEFEENEADSEQVEVEIADAQNQVTKKFRTMILDPGVDESAVSGSEPIESEQEENTPLEESNAEVLPLAPEGAFLLPRASSAEAGFVAASNESDVAGLEEEQPQSKSRKKTWVIVGAIFVLLAVAAVAFYIFNVNTDEASKQPQATSVPKNIHPDSLANAASKPQVVAVTKDTLTGASADSTKTSASMSGKGKGIQKEKEDAPAISKTTTEVVSEGATFRTLALKYYGSKEFWVYIYQANKAKIPHPNKLRYGLSVTIPDAKTLGIDAKDPASIKRAILVGNKVLNEIN